MSTFPTTPRADFMEWCSLHGPIFTANAAAIGLTPAQASGFNTLLTAAENAITAQGNARLAMKNSTENVDDAVAALQASAGDLVRIIRSFAEVQSKPLNVYTAASISPPQPRTPVPPPGQPTNLTVSITPNSGALKLNWKCVNPANGGGTTYLVRRRLSTESGFSFIGTADGKEFIDTSVPAGCDWVAYIVNGQRSSITGPGSDMFTIHFGAAGGGGGASSGMTVSSRALQPGEAELPSTSTVNGKAVSKTLPNGNGRKSRV